MALVALGAGAALLLGGCDRGGERSTGGKSITVVIAEYSKDHTKPFWQALSEQYAKQGGAKVDLRIIDWNSIDQQVSTMIQNNQPPDVLNLNSFSSYAKDHWNHFFAASVLAIVPVVVLFATIERHLVGGLTAGSVK
jgi:multiple sugar transport system substrate-binding protein